MGSAEDNLSPLVHVPPKPPTPALVRQASVKPAAPTMPQEHQEMGSAEDNLSPLVHVAPKPTTPDIVKQGYVMPAAHPPPPPTPAQSIPSSTGPAKGSGPDSKHAGAFSKKSMEEKQAAMKKKLQPMMDRAKAKMLENQAAAAQLKTSTVPLPPPPPPPPKSQSINSRKKATGPREYKSALHEMRWKKHSLKPANGPGGARPLSPVSDGSAPPLSRDGSADSKASQLSSVSKTRDSSVDSNASQLSSASKTRDSSVDSNAGSVVSTPASSVSPDARRPRRRSVSVASGASSRDSSVESLPVRQGPRPGRSRIPRTDPSVVQDNAAAPAAASGAAPAAPADKTHPAAPAKTHPAAPAKAHPAAPAAAVAAWPASAPAEPVAASKTAHLPAAPRDTPTRPSSAHRPTASSAAKAKGPETPRSQSVGRSPRGTNAVAFRPHNDPTTHQPAVVPHAFLKRASSADGRPPSANARPLSAKPILKPAPTAGGPSQEDSGAGVQV